MYLIQEKKTNSTYEFVHHAPKQLQIGDILLLDAHLRQLPRYQVELGHLVVVAVHDGLQLLKLVSTQAPDQILQLLNEKCKVETIKSLRQITTCNSSGSRGFCI